MLDKLIIWQVQVGLINGRFRMDKSVKRRFRLGELINGRFRLEFLSPSGNTCMWHLVTRWGQGTAQTG